MINDKYFLLSSQEKTPEKRTRRLEEADNDFLNSSPSSPDLIPPTPPLPKRLKLDCKQTRLTKSGLSLSKLQPGELKFKEISDGMLLHPSEIVTSTEKELPLASEPVPNKVKEVKKDFYHLGRHKVLECFISENNTEKCVLLQPEDDSINHKRQCLLRDFWYTIYLTFII